MDKPKENTTTSVYKIYYDKVAEKVFPIYTAIVYVNKGVIEGILFDDGCTFCGSNSCEQSSYFYENGSFVVNFDIFILDT